MKLHTKVFFEFYGYIEGDFIPCMVCGSGAVDIHHIKARGMGGNNRNLIENLISLCRKCHIEYGDKKQHREFLKSKVKG